MEPLSFFVEYKSIWVMAHVIGVIIGMGAALVSDGLFSFYSRDKILSPKELRVFTILSRIVWIGLAVTIITGIGIFFSSPAVYGASVKFLVKMTIVGVITLNGYVIHRYIKPHFSRGFLTSSRERSARMTAFICGAVSLVSWISAFILGLMKAVSISYGELISIYLVVLAVVVCGAVIVQKKKFA